MRNDPDALELAARIRAARGYAGVDQKDMGPLLGISARTYARREAGEWPAGDRHKLLPAVQRITGVPEWFLERGWSPPATRTNDPQRSRINRLERRLDQLDDLEDLMREQLERIEALEVLAVTRVVTDVDGTGQGAEAEAAAPRDHPDASEEGTQQ
jgi:transcriptional regulator with XRE-family HTH domain